MAQSDVAITRTFFFGGGFARRAADADIIACVVLGSVGWEVMGDDLSMRPARTQLKAVMSCFYNHQKWNASLIFHGFILGGYASWPLKTRFSSQRRACSLAFQ
jgi:hypothetical protein